MDCLVSEFYASVAGPVKRLYFDPDHLDNDESKRVQPILCLPARLK